MKGKTIQYEVIRDGQTMLKTAKVIKGEFHPQLGRLYTCITPFGYEIQLTHREIILKERV